MALGMSRRGAWAGAALTCLVASGAPRSLDAQTLGDVVASVESGVRDLGTRANAASVTHLQSLRAFFETRQLVDAPTGDVARALAGQPARFGTVLRADPMRVTTAATVLRIDAGVRDSVRELQKIATLVIIDLQGLPAPPSSDALAARFAALTDLNVGVIALAQARNLERVRRFEVKYGEGSPQLNLVEAVLNVALQRVPMFGPTREGDAGPLELVASYHPAEPVLGETRGEGAAVASSGQLGLRHYNFGAGWGSGSTLRQLVRPRYWSVGALMIGPEGRALREINLDGSDVGAFIGWGTLRAGWVFGERGRIVLGSDKLILPHLF